MTSGVTPRDFEGNFDGNFMVNFEGSFEGQIEGEFEGQFYQSDCNGNLEQLKATSKVTFQANLVFQDRYST